MNPPSKFPTLTLIAGFFTGQDSLHLLNSENTNLNSVTLAFQYPFNLEDIKKDPSKFLHLLRLTPGQIALLLTWLKRQSWSDSEKSTVMGVSLGGLFLPVSIHIAQKLGSYQKNTIFVCTGGDLSKILKPNLEQLFGTYFSQLIADSLFDLTSILSPELHAPWLESKFLFIRTKEDQVFSPQSSQILFDHLNSPKIEIVLDGPHVMPDQIELIHRIEKTIKTWLR
jgi:hypothetical protein